MSPGGAYMETRRRVFGPSGLFLEQARPPSSRHWALDGDILAIGRDPASAIYVDDLKYLQAITLTSFVTGFRGLIVDARSTNGTFVNDRRVNESVLQAL